MANPWPDSGLLTLVWFVLCILAVMLPVEPAREPLQHRLHELAEVVHAVGETAVDGRRPVRVAFQARLRQFPGHLGHELPMQSFA